jgi:hypothetical protein
MAEKKADKLTTKQIAEALGTTPRELRVFLRASDDYNGVGSGSRYAFETKDVGPMKTRFETWRKARDEAKAAKAEADKAAAEEPATDDAPAEEPKPQARRSTTRKATPAA